MAKRIFRVDLSDGARDFKPVATEPGLPMLDRANANFTILNRWLGNMAAEPVWIGEDSINIFVLGDEGRLDKIDCVPVSKADLEGPLAADLKTLQARIKKAKPESATEQSLHRVTRQTVAQLANDLDAGGQDCFFFKYRRGKDPWKLVWCWGYQRTDQEPAIASVCTNPECHQIFVKRPQNKNKCPGCDETPSARRGGSSGAGGGVFALPAVRYGGIAALALLALLLFLYFGLKQQLVVTPGDISGAAGSKVDYKVFSRRFWILDSDVTTKAQPQLFDNKLVEVDYDKKYMLFKRKGKTEVEFEYGGKKIKSAISIGSPATPKSLVIEPKTLTVSVEGEKDCKVIGYYPNDVKIDLTEEADWDVKDGAIGYANEGTVKGFAPGKSTVIAKYRGKPSDKYAENSIPLEVGYAPGVIAVSPNPVRLAIDEAYALDIQSSDKAPFVLESSDPKIVEIQSDNRLVGKGAGSAQVTVKQGSASETVTVHVKGSPYKSIHIIPATLTLKPGQIGSIKVVGRNAAGNETEISADKLRWIKQPLIQYADLNTETLKVIGMEPTPAPLEMSVELGGELTAIAKYEVKKDPKSTEIEDVFKAYPPIAVGVGNISVDSKYFGKGLKFSDTGGMVVTELEDGSPLASLNIPRGSMIMGIDGYGLEGAGISAAREYLLNNPIRDGARIQYRHPKTGKISVVKYSAGPVSGVGDVTLLAVKAVDLNATDFQGELILQVLEAGDYRLLDADNKPLSKSQMAAANSKLTFISDKIPRDPKDAYDIKVERTTADGVKRFQVTFKLKEANK